MKNYTIKMTPGGPCIFNNTDMFFLSDGAGVFDWIDTDPELIFDLKQAVSNYLEYETGVMIDALSFYRRHDPAGVRTALEAIMQYHKFIYQDYPDYRSNVAKALTGEVNHDTVFESNPSHINEFYKLLQGA